MDPSSQENQNQLGSRKNVDQTSPKQALPPPSSLTSSISSIKPPHIHVRSYTCTFCEKGFSNAQALGGHMNIHRRDRARLRNLDDGSDFATNQTNLITVNWPDPARSDDVDLELRLGSPSSSLLAKAHDRA
ncbi:hypothetical protein V2J09_010482 [Rumex salicifolius]